jgi:hypothetical protein
LEDVPEDELVETEDGRLVRLAFSRPWPRYVVSWSIRRKVDESDFPVVSGEVEAGPGAGDTAETWNRLRERALQEASASGGNETEAKAVNGGSWFRKLFGSK